MSRLLQIDDFDFSKIVYGNPYIKDNIMAISLYYSEQENESQKRKRVPIILKIPTLLCENIYDPNINKIILNMEGKNEIDMSNVTSFLKTFDNKIISDVQKNSRHWKLKNCLKYIPLLEHIDKKQFIFRFSLVDTQDFSTKVFTNTKQLLSKNEYQDYINGNSYVKSIVEFDSIIINNNEVSIYVRPHQLRVTPKKQTIIILSEYAMSDSDYDNDNDNDQTCNINVNSNSCKTKPTGLPITVYEQNYECEFKHEHDDEDNEYVHNSPEHDD